jgi:putative Ca2+/H+ antiporter (TMEM165/GDT1 family)
MLTTVTLASQHQAFVPVWLGSTLGMVVADSIAVVVGVVAGRRLPQRAIKLVSAGIFVVFGIWAIATAVTGMVGA